MRVLGVVGGSFGRVEGKGDAFFVHNGVARASGGGEDGCRGGGEHGVDAERKEVLVVAG